MGNELVQEEANPAFANFTFLVGNVVGNRFCGRKNKGLRLNVTP